MHRHYLRVLASGVTDSVERDTMGFPDTEGDRATDKYVWENTSMAIWTEKVGILLIRPIFQCID